jgi:hypothetical protein
VSVGATASTAAPDITKPLMAAKNAEGCESLDEVTQLLSAAPGAVVTGCVSLDEGTRGYFLDEKGDASPTIELDIEVDHRQRVLWVPAGQLRN